MIQGQIDILDDFETPTSALEEYIEIDTPTKNGHFSLGSKVQMLSLHDLVLSDAQFSRFHIRLSKFISELLPASNIPLPDGRYFNFSASDMVCLQLCISFKVYLIINSSFRLLHIDI